MRPGKTVLGVPAAATAALAAMGAQAWYAGHRALPRFADDLWMGQVARRLARDYQITVRSHAVGGAHARDVLMYQVRAAVRDAPTS